MSAESPACHGVTLEQYAGITAALADDLPLRAALDNEGLDEPAWKLASRGWKQRIAGGGIEGPLFVELQQKLVVAEDCLDRPVTPLADDLHGWVSFLQTWSTHPAPFDLLTAMQLRMADVARLQRRWSRRLEGDDGLRRQAADLAEKGAGPLPVITVGATELRPFPWSRRRAAADEGEGKGPGAEAGGDPGDLSLDRYAALCAVLAEPAVDRAGVLARWGVDEAQFAALDAAWKQRLGADEALARDHRRMFGHQRARLRAAALRGTSLAMEVPRGPALPFVEGEALPAIAASAVHPPRRPAGTLAAMAGAAPRGPALPFAGVQEPVRAPHPLAGTALALEVPRGPALPFVEGEAPPEVSEPAHEPPPKRPAGGLGETSVPLDPPRGPALPFAAPAQPAAPASPNKLGQRRAFELPASLRAKPVEPAPPASPAPASPELASPAFTLQQYASLCVEIAAAPEHSAEVLARYWLSPATREALDCRYQERFAREPGLRAEWELACATYRDWLATRGPR